MANNKLELILSLSIAQFQQAVKQVGTTINAMGGQIGKAMNGADSSFRKVIASSQAYNNTLQSLNGTADHFKNTMVQMAGVLGGAAIFGSAARQAVSFNSTVEQSRIGVAALVRTFTTADMGQSFVQAEDIQKRLQIAGLQTTATYEQLLRALQEGIGPALRENFNPQQVVSFTQAMTQAGAALALPMDQLGQELRAILDGTIDRNARIANALRITNEDVKGWKEAGTLFDNLKKRLQAFSAAGEQAAKTYAGAWSNVQDAVQMALGKASEDSFKKTTEFFLKLKDAIVTVDEAAGTFTFNKKIMAAFAEVDAAISKTIGSLTTEQISAMLINLVGTFGAVAEAVITFVASLIKVGEALGPLGPTIASVITWATLLLGSFKLLAGLPILLYQQLVALNAGFTAMAGGGLLLYIKHVQQASQHSGILRTAIASLPNAVATAGGLMAAALAGWSFGTWLRQFDVVERAGISLAAGLTKAWLNAKGAWAWLFGTDADMARVKQELAEVDRIYGEMFANVGKGAKGAAEEQKRLAVEAEKSALLQSNAQKTATDAMKKAYKDYADTVKKLQDDIAGREQDLAAQLREMGRSGMSDMGAWKDRKREAEEYAVAAKRAAEESKKAFAAGEATTGQSKADEAVKLYDKARGAAADLNREIKAGDTVIVSQEQNLKKAMAMVEEYGRAGIEVQKNLKQEITDVAGVLNEQSGGALVKELPEIAKQFGKLSEKAEDLAKKSEDFNTAWNGAWDDFLEKGTADIYDLDNRLTELTKDRNITVHVREVVEKSTGGLLGYMRGGLIQALATGGTVVRNILAGGFLPGFGGGDTVPLYGERGEVMINKDAVKEAGLTAALAFNSKRWDVVISELLKMSGMNIRGILGYQFGGLISAGVQQVQELAIGPQYLAAGGAVQGAASMATYNLTVNYTGSAGRSDVDALTETILAKLAEMHRRRSS